MSIRSRTPIGRTGQLHRKCSCKFENIRFLEIRLYENSHCQIYDENQIKLVNVATLVEATDGSF